MKIAPDSRSLCNLTKLTRRKSIHIWGLCHAWTSHARSERDVYFAHDLEQKRLSHQCNAISENFSAPTKATSERLAYSPALYQTREMSQSHYY